MDEGLSVREIKAIDDFTINTIGIPSLVLMERAALSLAESILRDYSHQDILIVCGTGNNGGDGIAAGRILHQAGRHVVLYLVGKFDKASVETKSQLHIAVNLNIKMIETPEQVTFSKETLIVDGLFGIGLNRAVNEPYLSVIQSINQSQSTVVSVDLPSGLSADTGLVYNKAIKAEKTYTIGFLKKGFYMKEARDYTGKIDVLEIGYPPRNDYLHLLESER